MESVRRFHRDWLFNNYTLQETMSAVLGTHTLRFGFDLMNQRARQAAPFNERGTLATVRASCGRG
jgi:hypothetical protein